MLGKVLLGLLVAFASLSVLFKPDGEEEKHYRVTGTVGCEDPVEVDKCVSYEDALAAAQKFVDEDPQFNCAMIYGPDNVLIQELGTF